MRAALVSLALLSAALAGCVGEDLEAHDASPGVTYLAPSETDRQASLPPPPPPPEEPPAPPPPP
ncbi:MAG TPA: hypothetical protein VM681_06555, partial [Candidatus Thermoplasmatota archaeon]|nr:hypothetical protein [Candidatus Thermoplasmatota archaeon]